VASLTQNQPTITLPDFCNLGVLLRTLVLVNLMCLGGALAKSPTLNGIWQEILNYSLLVQPALLFSLGALCASKKMMQKLDYRTSIVLVFLLELLIVTGMLYFFAPLLTENESSNPLRYWLLCLLMTAAVLLYFNMRNRALSPALTEARLQALQARIRPHFLFNSINAVLSLVRKEPQRAERALEDMADLFRVLMADNKQLTRLEDEVKLCRQYLDLEQLRLGERLQIAWHVEKMPGDAMVPPLILQPLLENAVYHGIEPLSEPGEINLNIYRNKDNQVIIVLRNPYSQEGSHHIGNKMAMGNIRERLSLHFDVEASLKTQITGNSYQATITLPYTKQK
jgi:two-component system, LytTR family, sensor histidine kinase AlgZ